MPPLLLLLLLLRVVASAAAAAACSHTAVSLCFEFSNCVCLEPVLVKRSCVYTLKNGQNTSFLQLALLFLGGLHKNASYFGAFRLFVPSLPWQKDSVLRVVMKRHHKQKGGRFSHLPLVREDLECSTEPTALAQVRRHA
jgi:hypothetical protein